jgi:archaemetzincin
VSAPVPRRRLEIIPAGGVALPLLRSLAAAVDAALSTGHVIAPALDPSAARGDDGTVDSTRLLDAVLALAPDGDGGGGGWRLAVTDAALRNVEGEPVFGEAAVGGGCAVVGLGALDAGNDCGETSLVDRAAKTAVHELAHAAGLEHCADPTCVMYPSRRIADTDRKAIGFCARCADDFRHATLDAARS